MHKPFFRWIPALTLLCTCALAAAQTQSTENQPAQERSLGDVAKAQEHKKTPAKVIDDDEMNQRRANRGAAAGDSALVCDDACVAAVKTAVQQDPRLRMTDAQWRAALAGGEDEFAADSEWSDLLSELRQQICQRRAGAVDPDKAKALDRRVNKKLLDDVRDDLDMVSRAMQAGNTQAAVDQAADAARARAIKLQIVKVQAELAKQSACGAASPAAKGSQTN